MTTHYKTEVPEQYKHLPLFSASKLKTFKTCHRLYQHKYVTAYSDRPIEDKNASALLGTALHKAIELRYKDNTNPLLTFQEVMTKTMQDWDNAGFVIKGEENFAKLLKEGKDIILKMDWDQFIPEVLEYEFILPFPNPENPIAVINGFIDMITLDGSVIDHKSAKRKPDLDELNNDPQFIIYSWAYRQIYKFKPYKLYWHHLRNLELIEANVDYDYDNKIAQLILDIEALINVKYFPRREMDEHCRKLCSFYELCYGKRDKDIEEE